MAAVTFSGLIDALLADPGVQASAQDVRAGVPAADLTCAPAARPLLSAALQAHAEKTILLVTSTFREAEELTRQTKSIIGDDAVCYYPAWETLPHERISPRSDTVGRRLQVLRRLQGAGESGVPKIVVAPVRALLQPQVKGLAKLRPVVIAQGDEIELPELARRLMAAAYARVDLVERRGQFAIRGGIVDVFAPTSTHPVRIDFFGDQIDSITFFEVADQRSTGQTLDEVVAPPCRELLLTDQVRARAAALVDDHPELAELLTKVSAGQAVEGMEALIPALVDELELLVDVLPSQALVVVVDPELVRARAEDLVRTSAEFLGAGWAAAASGGRVPIDLAASSYWSLADVREHTLTSGRGWWSLSQFSLTPGDLPAGNWSSGGTSIHGLLAGDEVKDPGAASLRGIAPGQVASGEAAPGQAATGEAAPGQAAPGGLTPTAIAPRAVAKSAQTGPDPAHKAQAGRAVQNGDPAAQQVGLASRTLNLVAIPSWHGDVEQALDQIQADQQAGLAVVVTTEGHGLGARLRQLLGEREVPVQQDDELAQPPQAGVVTIVTTGLVHGFRAPGAGLVVHAAGDITGSHEADRSRHKMPRKRRNQVVPLELKPGDALVHEQHGVGRFVELTQREVGGARREYLVLEYAASKRGQPRDRVYVPMDQLDLVTRYVGEQAPQLDKMGGADWRARKSRARKAVKHIAAGLIKLYAARQATKGHAFSPDTVWQRELEDAFTYTETPDQLAGIQDVKRDMEQVVPMDRLISGDVGYGKTEIAVRAAFKAVQDGKQVAVLVPTTLLVQQHTQTFTDRYAGFPVTVAAMSRFQTGKEIADTIDGLASGRVDVVIGTHRLFSDKVKFKDLGLVIIDEEQRFGVEHKEALKKLRVNVDVLSMSATPIPRTLEMAITGIREMSTIATPPEERHPVLTLTGPYDDGQVAAAIRRELAREGQVFFVHNRVTDIEKTAARLREAVPEARIVTAHGQMSERQLEQVMLDFWQRRADVLVSTTIVEAGLDISTANTLIVDHADQLGLSQLHQLRGRVGRGRERGYAYFLYPPAKTLTQTAHDRLAAIAVNSGLGAGTAIAMKDLEIRGAGNLLGDEQSGHIADVGFDLYLRLVGEAVAEYRGQTSSEDVPQMRIELPVEAHLPVDYVESERLRLEMYRRLAEVRTDDDIDEVRAELADRFGPVPEAALRLLAVAKFRLLCRSVGLHEVVAQAGAIRFAPVNGRRLADGSVVDLPESRQLRLQRLFPGTVLKTAANLMLVPKPRPNGVLAAPIGDDELLDWATRLVNSVFVAS